MGGPMIKVGFIGAGRRAITAHYPAVRRLADAEISAISDLDASRLNAAGDKFGVEQRYSDYHQMLAEADLERELEL